MSTKGTLAEPEAPSLALVGGSKGTGASCTQGSPDTRGLGGSAQTHVDGAPAALGVKVGAAPVPVSLQIYVLGGITAIWVSGRYVEGPIGHGPHVGTLSTS